MSLNLAQAVLLMAWEWRMAALSDNEQMADGPEGVSAPADLEKRAYFMSRLQDVLAREGFFKNAEMAFQENLPRRFLQEGPPKASRKAFQGVPRAFQEGLPRRFLQEGPPKASRKAFRGVPKAFQSIPKASLEAP